MYFTFLDILDAVGTFVTRRAVLWVIAWLLPNKMVIGL